MNLLEKKNNSWLELRQFAGSALKFRQSQFAKVIATAGSEQQRPRNTPELDPFSNRVTAYKRRYIL